MTDFSNIEIESASSPDLSQDLLKDAEYVLKISDDASIFHTTEWNRLIAEYYHLHPTTLVAKKDGIPVGLYHFFTKWIGPLCIILQSPISEYYTPYGGPIAAKEDRHNVISALIKESEKITHALRYTVVTPPDYDSQPFIENGYSVNPCLTSIIDLTGDNEKIFQNFNRKTRRSVNKTYEKKLEFIVGNLSNVNEFYTFDSELLRPHGLSHILDPSFYSRMMEILAPVIDVKLVFATYEEKRLGGAVTFGYKDRVYLWKIASNKDYHKYSPNYFLYCELIKYAKQAGYLYFDLLVIEPDRLPGLAHFKMGWGGKTINFYSLNKETALYRTLHKSKFLEHIKDYVRNRKKKGHNEVKMTNDAQDLTEMSS